MDAKQRLTELCELLTVHSHHYYVLDNPQISDGEYDILFQELLEIETEHPDWVTVDSPSQRVGGEALDKFEQVEHRISMLSLENAFSILEVPALSSVPLFQKVRPAWRHIFFHFART